LHATEARRECKILHRDPLHTDDFLDRLARQVGERWQSLGGRPDQLELARESKEISPERHAPEEPAPAP
jgi:hypothetical protein